MPFRLSAWRAKIQFTTSAEMPSMIYQACKATGTVSGTVYCQHALAHALARDLDLPVELILEGLPPPRGPAAHLYDPEQHTMARHPVTVDPSGGVDWIGPANTDEEVR